jgi:tRNA/tmRNA/rRNA uracil-C5-methylase (TrmA/RlmC/RlmD family)
VVAIEQDARALRDAERLQLAHTEWVTGRVEDYLESVCQRLSSSPGLILMDPPRTGLGRTISEALAQSQARRIIYVSCNPSTLARDAGFLKSAYRLTSLQPIDMFPRTAQIESVSIWDLR